MNNLIFRKSIIFLIFIIIFSCSSISNQQINNNLPSIKPTLPIKEINSDKETKINPTNSPSNLMVSTSVTPELVTISETVAPEPIISPIPLAISFNTSIAFKDIKDWLGEKFIFLPIKNINSYYSFKKEVIPKDDLFGEVKFNEAVNRIGTVISVKDISFGEYEIRLKMDDTGEIFIGKSSFKRISHIAYLKDFEEAKKELINKDVWFTFDNGGVYKVDATSGYSFLNLQGGEKLRITDVILSDTYDDAPIRLILDFNGQKGYKDITFSGTNVFEDLRESFSFNGTFSPIELLDMNKYLGGSNYLSSPGCTSNCTVVVRDYFRKDGTFVKGYRRSPPRSKK